MITLIAIGVLYVALGVWCTIAPRSTAAGVGFELRGGAGMSEFVTVYGGLEVGLGLAMIVTAAVPALRPGGLVFALVFSAMLPLFRLPTLFVCEVSRATYGLFAVETAFAAALLVAWWRS